MDGFRSLVYIEIIPLKQKEVPSAKYQTQTFSLADFVYLGIWGTILSYFICFIYRVIVSRFFYLGICRAFLSDCAFFIMWLFHVFLIYLRDVGIARYLLTYYANDVKGAS